MAAVVVSSAAESSHRLGSLKQPTVVGCSSVDRKSNTGLPGLKSRCGRAAFFSGASRGESVCLFQHLGAACVP